MKRNIKKLIPYILIVLAIILLGIVISIVLQFTFRGEVIDLSDPETPYEEKTYHLDNESDMSEDEIVSLINSKRDEMMAFFDPIKYYNLTDVDPSFSAEDNQKYMVLTDEFTNSLRFMVTSNLYEKLVRNFEFLKIENNINYYMVLKDEFTPLHSNSAIAIFDYTDLETHPTYANESKIESVIRYKICDDEVYNFCRRDEEYKFVLVKDGSEWFIDDIGVPFDD